MDGMELVINKYMKQNIIFCEKLSKIKLPYNKLELRLPAKTFKSGDVFEVDLLGRSICGKNVKEKAIFLIYFNGALIHFRLLDIINKSYLECYLEGSNHWLGRDRYTKGSVFDDTLSLNDDNSLSYPFSDQERLPVEDWVRERLYSVNKSFNAKVIKNIYDERAINE